MHFESSRTNEKSGEEKIREVAEEAIARIDNAWDKMGDPEGLSFGPDFTFEEIQEQLEAHARAYGEALFHMARSTTGKERMRYADGFSHLLRVIKNDAAEKVLENLLTNRETVKELQRKAREEDENEHPHAKSGGFFSRWWRNA